MKGRNVLFALLITPLLILTLIPSNALTAEPYCGDGFCTDWAGENCETCSQDCGACPPVPDAPDQHADDRLNFNVCRAPIAVYLNEDGSLEIWTTDPTNMYTRLMLKVTATDEEITAALALAEETGEDVIIAGYAGGVALIAKPDGTVKAELIGVYGFDFMPDGSENNGWGYYFEYVDY